MQEFVLHESNKTQFWQIIPGDCEYQKLKEKQIE